MNVGQTSAIEPITLFSFNEIDLFAAKSAKKHEVLLTVADVEQVTGLKGITLVPFNPARFLGSDLNFVAADGRKILSVEFAKAGQFETYKVLVPKNYKSEIPGVGQEAFMGPDIADQAPYLLVFRQDGYTVALTVATTSDTRKNMLTIEQLLSLGKTIASRLAK